MTNILLINGASSFAYSKGSLNHYLTQVTHDLLISNNCSVTITNVDGDYDLTQEVSKYLLSDVVIYQMPVWWMTMPWTVKKYIDEVFTHGHGKMYASDGRSRDDLSKKYGSGGLLQGKKYMISVTWNAPVSSINDDDDFFEGVGIDTVFLNLHKANQFLGMEPIATFMCNNVMKDPNIVHDVDRLKQHLVKHILS